MMLATLANFGHSSPPRYSICSRRRSPPSPAYLTTEIATAVRRAFDAKRGKGTAYSADILLLHALPAAGKPYFSGVGIHGENIAELGQVMATQEKDLCERFDEIWFLNVYTTEGRRLYRLK